MVHFKGLPHRLVAWLTIAFIFVVPAGCLAQGSELEALRSMVKGLEQQLQKALVRIDQLEKQKGEGTIRTAQPEPKQSSEPVTVPSPATPSKGILSALNPAISVNTLFGGGYSSSPRATSRLTGLEFQNGFNFQEAEFQFTADVDPYWKGNFILAVDRAGNAEIEEGYVTSEQLPYDLLPRDTSLKLGKFFAGFGKHNLLHAHQFPFIDPPLISQAVFGGEGLREPGLGVNYLLPVSWFSELTAQAMAGENEGLFFLREGAKPRGAYLGHWKNFFDVTDFTTLEVGQSYVAGRNSDAGHRLSQAVGLDLTMKWRPLQRATERALIWQSEYLYSSRDHEREPANRGGGLYSSLQYQFARRWWLQGRYDLLGIPKFDDGRKHRWTTLLALVPSEFSAIRLQHSYTAQERRSPLNQILLQLSFTIGSHPAHQY